MALCCTRPVVSAYVSIGQHSGSSSNGSMLYASSCACQQHVSTLKEPEWSFNMPQESLNVAVLCCTRPIARASSMSVAY
jgi:hypothetical protein